MEETYPMKMFNLFHKVSVSEGDEQKQLTKELLGLHKEFIELQEDIEE